MDTDEMLYLKNKWRDITNTINTLLVEKILVRKRIKEIGGTLTGQGIGRPAEHHNAKHEHVIALFKEGKTIQEIADLYGFTRQRAQQILKRNGFSAKDGGSSLKSIQKHCSVDGCLIGGKITKGYCTKHYGKFLRYGDPLKVPANRVHAATCSVEGCERPYKSSGFCNTHRTRFSLKGDAGSAEIIHVGKHKDRGKQIEARKSKISEPQKEEIRSLYVRGNSGRASEFSTTGLSKRFGLSPMTISNIVNNKI